MNTVDTHLRPHNPTFPTLRYHRFRNVQLVCPPHAGQLSLGSRLPSTRPHPAGLLWAWGIVDKPGWHRAHQVVVREQVDDDEDTQRRRQPPPS
jgi:hypothetical protein